MTEFQMKFHKAKYLLSKVKHEDGWVDVSYAGHPIRYHFCSCGKGIEDLPQEVSLQLKTFYQDEDYLN